MYKWISLATALLVLAASGCGNRGPRTTGTGPQGEKLSLSVPETPVAIKQGGEEKFSVTVGREDLEGDVELEINGLPKGVSIVEENRTIPKGKADLILTLKASPDAEIKKEAPVRVSATAGQVKVPAATFKLTVSESLENRKARREAAVTKFQERLDKIQSDFKAIEKE